MKEISVQHETFNPTKTSTYHLSLQMGMYGYAYTISDTIRKQFVALKKITFDTPLIGDAFSVKMKEILKTDILLNKNYKSVSFLFISRKSILIPESYFDRTQLKEYLKFHFHLQEFEEIQYNYIAQAKAYDVYSIPSYLTTMLVNKFPQIEFYHHNPFLAEVLKMNDQEQTFLALDIYVSFVQVAYVENGQLKFSNAFEFGNENDMLYRILQVAESFSLDKKSVPVNISGHLTSEDSHYKLLEKYFANISFRGHHESKDYGYPFQQVDSHLFVNLLSLEQ